MGMRYRAFLWDLDGTLLNTLDDLYASVNAALAGQGLPPRTKEQVAAFTGHGIQRLMEQAAPPGCDGETRAAAYAAFCAHYAAHCRDATRPYDGVTPLLRRIREAGGQNAIVSNKAAFAVEELAARYFLDTVTAAFGACDAIPCKPDPALVQAALERLGAAREEALYIGDSEVDVATARAAGVPAVFVTWGFRTRAALLDAGAGRLMDTPQQLEDWIFEEGTV